MHIAYRKVYADPGICRRSEAVHSRTYLDDINDCLGLVRKSRAYGTCLDPFPDLLGDLLLERRISLAVIEETCEQPENAAISHNGHKRIVGFRCTCFVRDSFVVELLTGARLGHMEPRQSVKMYQRCLNGNSPILTRQEIAHHNAHEGLNFLSYTVHDQTILQTEEGVHAYATAIGFAFHDLIGGYQIKRCLVENYGPHPLVQMPKSGFIILTQYEPFYRQETSIPEDFRFFIAYTDREVIQRSEMHGTYMYHVLHYSPPRLCLTPKQQDVLEYALVGETDDQLALRFGVDESAIRQRFRTIYQRVREIQPDILAQGRERNGLLHYLRNHPEEFRPYAP